jgi:hypothetical protein
MRQEPPAGIFKKQMKPEPQAFFIAQVEMPRTE